MNAYKIINKTEMKCPICGKTHELEERLRDAETVIKGQVVRYKENYLFCSNADEEENEFEIGGMVNANLMNARNAYRLQNGLLTSDEIVQIREEYGLSQVDLARLLGWGEATISRYESKAIQDEAYDNTLRLFKDSPYLVLEYFKKNASAFSTEKMVELKKRINERIDAYGREYLSRQTLKAEYVDYDEPSDLNGNYQLNIDKLEAVISYYAKNDQNLFKVKLMKMLWYADVISFKERGRSMTGLVYQHKDMGALPVGHNKILGLDRVNVQEESSVNYDLLIHFYPYEKMDYKVIDKSEQVILDKVLTKFDKMTTKEIVDYMHEEKAYKKTKDGELIPFSLASQLRED